MSVYRKGCSTQHVLMRLIEEWKSNLDIGYVVGAILMDLCLKHLIVLHMNF